MDYEIFDFKNLMIILHGVDSFTVDTFFIICYNQVAEWHITLNLRHCLFMFVSVYASELLQTSSNKELNLMLGCQRHCSVRGSSVFFIPFYAF